MPIPDGALEPLLRLSLVPGIGPQRLTVLIRQFGSAARALAAPISQLRLLPSLGPEVAARIREHAGPIGDQPVRRALVALRRLNAVALTPEETAYPDSFRALSDPPYLLFAAGRLELLDFPAVALVGTRRPSHYGRATTASLAEGLASLGYVVVSGMARGIDTEAHSAVLAAGGSTIAVLGHGLDSCYPPENRDLFTRISLDGLLLTEFPPGERPRAGNFPRRNRLIASLSRAVVVVEMGLKSGAQHTVNYALENGREVMAVPGPIGSSTSAGTNQLIREGASMVTSVDDILEEIDGVGMSAPPRLARPIEQRALPLLAPEEDRVVQALSIDARHVDSISESTGIGPGPLLGLLLDLELRGFVESLPAKHYRLR